MSKTTYTFSGQTFTRPIASDEYGVWFESAQQYSKDVVLGATTAAQSYIDIGAAVFDPLTIRAQFASSAARETFVALQGTTATLSNTHGRSGSALLLSAKRVNGAAGVFYADLVFEAR